MHFQLGLWKCGVRILSPKHRPETSGPSKGSAPRNGLERGEASGTTRLQSMWTEAVWMEHQPPQAPWC